MPALRRKVVLQIGDGLIGTYDGGPGTWNPHFRTWEYRALFFATEPVAPARVGIQRVAEDLHTAARRLRIYAAEPCRLPAEGVLALVEGETAQVRARVRDARPLLPTA